MGVLTEKDVSARPSVVCAGVGWERGTGGGAGVILTSLGKKVLRVASESLE